MNDIVQVLAALDGAGKEYFGTPSQLLCADAARLLREMAAWIACVATCRCESCWTGRGLHAPECLADEVDERWRLPE